MSRVCLFFVPGEAIAQPRPRAVKVGKFSRVISAQSEHPINRWKWSIAHYAKAAMKAAPPTQQPVLLEMLFLMPRPKRLLAKRFERSVILHTSKPDLDNLEKAVKDALNCIAWVDDSQVSTSWKRKRYTLPDESPGVHVMVTLDTATSGIPFYP